MLATRICKNCQKEFKVYITPADIKRNFGRGSYCSRKCRSEYISKTKVDESSKLWKEKVKCICETCGTEFTKQRSDVERGSGKYCSRKCYFKSRGQPQEKRICETCGKEFDYYPNTPKYNPWSVGKYCSQECYKKIRNPPVKCVCDNCGKEFYRQASLYRINNKNRTINIYCSNKCKGKSKEKENNQNWAGGTANWPYCELFKSVRPRVRAFFNDRCFICGLSKEDNGRELDVHHVTYDKLACCHLDNISKLYRLTKDEMKAIELADEPTRKLIEIYKLTPDKVKEIEDERLEDNALMDEFGVPKEYRWMFVPLCHSHHGKTIHPKNRPYWKRYFIKELMKRTGGQSYLQRTKTI